MAIMKAYLIDPFKKEVTSVEYNGDFQQIYDLIDCSCFDVARINSHGDGIYVDDEGLIGDIMKQAFFMFSGYPNPLAGKGLVLGTDYQGESVEPHITLDELKSKVRFMTIDQIRRSLM